MTPTQKSGYFEVRGGKKLKGTIRVNGAKNSALKTLAATLLFKNRVTIENIPYIEDVLRTIELLEKLGVRGTHKGKTITLSTSKINSTTLDEEIAKCIRASIILAGPLLAREGTISFPHPGGCVIGKRPIDLFLEGWRAMGASVKESSGNGYTLTATHLKGCDFTFRNISVTGTEALMTTAVLAEGKTILRNAAREPEIPALAKDLNKAGARIEGAGTATIEIIGTNGKLLEPATLNVIPDRIEAGSFLILGALLGNKITIKNCNPAHLEVPIELLKKANIPITYGKDWIKVERPKIIKSINMQTREYPGFPTDLQAPYVVLMTQAKGESIVFETVFEGRLAYTEDLKRMGAHITPCDPHRVIVRGPANLHGREIETPDIRAGLAFLIAALTAHGTSTLHNIYQIDRGYEKIEDRLNKLGAHIKRIC
jgi:UDP-N-acetylglucosamine 1-carboxyvinyltransferase